MSVAPPLSSTHEVGAAHPAESGRGRLGRLMVQRPVPPWVVLVLLGVLALPVLTAAVALRRPTWFPVLDLAMTELRVRDVGGPHTPLIGLPGRIGTLEQQGSHPGPLSFWLLAPVYRLLGSSAWALQVSAAVLQVGAMATALVVARRRGGLRVVLAVAAILALLSLAYGFPVLTEPWNPYMPLLWWVAFLLAAWSVAIGDWWMLPVAVAVAGLCAQTHLPYLGLTGVLGALAVAVGAARYLRTGESLRRAARPLALAAVVAAVLWSPVALDQVREDPGNLSLLRAHMFDPPEDPAGFLTGAHVMLVHFDLSQMLGASAGSSGSLVDTDYDPHGPVAPGLAVLALWAASVLLAWRLRNRALWWLHLLVGAALVLGVYSTGRIFGKIWYYLTLWAWGLAVLAVAAAAATVLVALERRLAGPKAARLRQGTAVALVAAVVLPSGWLTAQAPGVDPPAARLSEALGLVVEPTAQALRDGLGAATGPQGRYVVSWTDALHIGSKGYGLMSELERRGLHAGGMPWARVPLTAHRVIEPDEATAIVHLATGGFIDSWRDRPGVVEVVHADPRTPQERAEFEALRVQVMTDLRDQGLGDLIPVVDGNLFGASLDDRLDDATHRRMGRMLDLGLPISVFIAPPGTRTL